MVTMATLTKLLRIRIEAKSSFGFDTSFIIRTSAGLSLLRQSSSCCELKEKYATSEPEIIAERNSNINTKKTNTDSPRGMAAKNGLSQ